MVNDHRVTLTRRHAYRTKSNRVKTIKTPGRIDFDGYHMREWIIFRHELIVFTSTKRGFYLIFDNFGS